MVDDVKLEPKQESFCAEYMIDLNATQAAIRAGYSEDTAKQIGSENLTKLDISEYIQELVKPKLKKLDITQDYVLNGIKDIADDLESRHIDKLKAYELLGKYLKLFTDKLDISIKEPIKNIILNGMILYNIKLFNFSLDKFSFYG